MRRISIQEKHVTLANNYEEVLKKGKAINGNKKSITPIKNLEKVRDSIKCSKLKVKINNKIATKKTINRIAYFFDWIINLANDKLFSCTPSQLLKTIDDFNNKFPDIKLNNKITIGKKKAKALYVVIYESMKYDEIRRYVMPQYIRKIGIKSCCYCNANYAITDSEKIGHYQLDHWKSKSLYPFLSISFFNLQPCCASCNLHKSNDDGEYFNLYTEDSETLDVFQFELSDKDKAKYIIDHDSSHLKVRWIEIKETDKKMRENMDSKLHITNVYAEHCDEVEELIWKQSYYKGAFLKALNESDLGINLTEDDINRFIIGTYSQPENIHLKPLTKMKQDIARQLGIIK